MDKDYKITNMEMVALERQGLLPIEVEAFEQAINFGNEFMEQGYVDWSIDLFVFDSILEGFRQLALYRLHWNNLPSL